MAANQAQDCSPAVHVDRVNRCFMIHTVLTIRFQEVKNGLHNPFDAGAAKQALACDFRHFFFRKVTLFCNVSCSLVFRYLPF